MSMSTRRTGVLVPAAALLAGAVAGAPCAAAEAILPAERTIDWTRSGVPGGIPRRTTVCATIRPGALQPVIQDALNACRANQVVLLSAGTYDVDGGLTIPSNVVLRGAGPKATFLKAAGSGAGFIRFGRGTTPSKDASVAVTGGATAKSTSLTLENTTGIGVGSTLMVTQYNDPRYVGITTGNGTCEWCDGGIGWKGLRVQGQIVEVTSVNGKTVGIAPALYVDYGHFPLATPVTMGATNAGVEDLQVVMADTGYTTNFLMQGTSSSWIRNVESNYADGNHVDLLWGYRNEIRDSYFHDAYAHKPARPTPTSSSPTRPPAR